MIPVTVSSKPVPASEDQLTGLINGDHYQREFAFGLRTRRCVRTTSPMARRALQFLIAPSD